MSRVIMVLSIVLVFVLSLLCSLITVFSSNNRSKEDTNLILNNVLDTQILYEVVDPSDTFNNNNFPNYENSI